MGAEIYNLSAARAVEGVGPAIGERLPDVVVFDRSGGSVRLRELEGPLVLEAGGLLCEGFGALEATRAAAQRHPGVPLVLLAPRCVGGPLLRDPGVRVLVDDAGGAVLRAMAGASDVLFVVGRTGRVVWRSDVDDGRSLDEVLAWVATPMPGRVALFLGALRLLWRRAALP